MLKTIEISKNVRPLNNDIKRIEILLDNIRERQVEQYRAIDDLRSNVLDAKVTANEGSILSKANGKDLEIFNEAIHNELDAFHKEIEALNQAIKSETKAEIEVIKNRLNNIEQETANPLDFLIED